MRDWMNMINEALVEDLAFNKIEDHKIVLDDPENDEVDNLKKASPKKKADILRDVEADMHESALTDAEWDAEFEERGRKARKEGKPVKPSEGETDAERSAWRRGWHTPR